MVSLEGLPRVNTSTNMSPYGCPGYPDDGVYYISVHNKWVGDKQAPGVDNIVVNNNKTVGLSILSD